MDIALQERLIKYALAHMRSAIHETQLKIIEHQQLLEHFSAAAISDFGVRLGSIKDLRGEAAQTAELLESDQQRLAVLYDDYAFVQERWQQVKDQDMAAAVRHFWERQQ